MKKTPDAIESAKTKGRSIVDAMFERSFSLFYDTMNAERGRPLTAEIECDVRARLERSWTRVSEEIFEMIPKRAGLDRTLFLETIRSECVACFMEKFRAKWASMVTN